MKILTSQSWPGRGVRAEVFDSLVESFLQPAPACPCLPVDRILQKTKLAWKAGERGRGKTWIASRLLAATSSDLACHELAA